MEVRSNTVTAITDGTGAATVYSGYISGHIKTIQYLKTDYTNGVDFVVTLEATGETVWSELNVDVAALRHPRASTHTILGAVSLYVAAGTNVEDKIALGRDRVKIVIASGGAAHTGQFVITTSDG